MENDVLRDISIFKSGWLIKQSRYSNKWKKTWFKLNSSQLLYGNSEEGPFKSIPLFNTIIEESNVSGRKYVFRLKPTKSHRDFLIQAPNQDEEQLWMQAICFAKVGAGASQQKQFCVIQ